MVLIDTSVWIDFFGNRPTRQKDLLETLIRTDEELCLCGVVLTEVLQGIRSDADYRKTKTYFNALIMLPMVPATFVRAADLYRSLRKEGVTIRKPIDCMIAAVAIENNVVLLHNDRDFDHIARRSALKIQPLD